MIPDNYSDEVFSKSTVEEQYLVDKKLFEKLNKTYSIEENIEKSSQVSDRSSKSTKRMMKYIIQKQLNVQDFMSKIDEEKIEKESNIQDLRNEYLTLEKQADDAKAKGYKNGRYINGVYYSDVGEYDYYSDLAEMYSSAAEKAKKVKDWEKAAILYQKAAIVFAKEADRCDLAIFELEEIYEFSQYLNQEILDSIFETFDHILEMQFKEIMNDDEYEELSDNQKQYLAESLIYKAVMYERFSKCENQIKVIYEKAIKYLSDCLSLTDFDLEMTQFIIALCLERIGEVDKANEIYNKIAKENLLVKELEEYTKEFDKFDFFLFRFLRPYLLVIKTVALKVHDEKKFMDISDCEIEALERYIYEIYNNEKLAEFFEKTKNLNDFEDIIAESGISNYFALCNVYAYKCDQINPQKAEEIRNKINNMKAYFHLDQLGSDFNEVFEENIKMFTDGYMKFYSDFEKSGEKILMFFDMGISVPLNIQIM